MKKQNRMEKLVRKMLIVAVAIFLLGTLIPLVGSAVEIGKIENQGEDLAAEEKFWVENGIFDSDNGGE